MQQEGQRPYLSSVFPATLRPNRRVGVACRYTSSAQRPWGTGKCRRPPSTPTRRGESATYTRRHRVPVYQMLVTVPCAGQRQRDDPPRGACNSGRLVGHVPFSGHRGGSGCRVRPRPNRTVKAVVAGDRLAAGSAASGAAGSTGSQPARPATLCPALRACRLLVALPITYQEPTTQASVRRRGVGLGKL